MLILSYFSIIFFYITTIFFFFFNDTATTEIYTLSLHDALPIYRWRARCGAQGGRRNRAGAAGPAAVPGRTGAVSPPAGRRPAPPGGRAARSGPGRRPDDSEDSLGPPASSSRHHGVGRADHPAAAG